MPLLRGCCTLDLQIGTKIIGVVSLIFSIIGFLTTGIICASVALMKEAVTELVRSAFPPGGDGTIVLSSSGTSNTDVLVGNSEIVLDETTVEKIRDAVIAVSNNMDTVLIVFLVILAQQFLDVLASSSLIHGIRKNRRGLLVPWMAMHVFYIFVELGLLVLFITITAYLNGAFNVLIPMIFIDLVWMGLHVYLILVVVSQFQALGLIRMHDEMSMKP